MKKQTQITAQSRQNLIDAFWSLYCEKRIEKITVKEIALRAGYNRSTFYEYFTDVYDVLEQLENSLIPKAGELPPIMGPEVQRDLTLNILIKLYERNSKYYSVLLSDNIDSSFAAKLKNAIKPMLKAEIREKVGSDEVEFDYIIEYMISAMIGSMGYWLRNNKNMPLEKFTDLVFDMAQKGVISKIRR